MFKKITTTIGALLFIILLIAFVMQYKAIQDLRNGNHSLVGKLDAISTSISADFADWTARLDTIESGYSNIESTAGRIQTSFDRRNKLDAEYTGKLESSYQRLSGLSEQLVTILNRASANDSEFDGAIERIEAFGKHVEIQLGIEGSGVPK